MERRLPHYCHARECEVRVPPAMFMCKKHWYTLPKPMREAVWGAYTPGQEIRMDPTDDYVNVVHRAIEWLAVKEGLRHVG